MRQSIHYLLSFLILFSSCSKETDHESSDVKYIKDIEILSHRVNEIKTDNTAKRITLLFDSGLDLSEVTIKLTLADNAKIVSPNSATATYDLRSSVEIKIEKYSEITTYILNAKFVSKPITIPADKWQKEIKFGNLPQYLSVYKYKKDISGKLTEAYIAVADITDGKGDFKILGEKKGYNTPSQFYEKNSRPRVVLNGGYFWSGNSLGLMIKNGKIISGAQPTVNRPYYGLQTPYFPTQGAFGLENNRSCTAQWVYESNNTLYAYPNPSPNIAGEMPQPRPYSDFPEGAKEWQPKEAIGAGPLLIKNGEYKNLWQNELFDEASGVGPTVNHPRSAVAYHPNGYIVLFVCEGRNKTPNTPGMTLKNVADILLELGCTEAINLDGGGSSCMLVNGKETIIPSDKNGQRPITNALAVY